MSETWTDNANLSADDPDDEWITEVAPGVRLTGEGRRARVDLGYRLQQVLHANESDRDRVNHQLNAEGDVELARERLFFNAGATRSLDTGGPLLSGVSNDLLALDERDTITTWRAGPRLQQEFGRFARLDAEASREEVDFGSRARGRSTADVFTAAVTSGSIFPDWGWALRSSVREEESTGNTGLQEETRFASASAELNWRIGAATQLFAVGGEEDNEFETAEAGDPIEGSFWEAGARWNPSRTVSLEAAVGERFFGETARGSISVVGRALSIQLNYSEDLVTTPQLQLERVNALLVDDQGNPVLGSDGQPVTAVIDVPTVVNDVILERRADLRVVRDYSHTRVSLTLQATDREFQRLGTSERSDRADLAGEWTRLTRTTVTAGVGYIDQEFAGLARQDETMTVRVGAQRRLRGGADLSGELEYLSRNSTEASAEYDSLRATVRLGVTF